MRWKARSTVPARNIVNRCLCLHALALFCQSCILITFRYQGARIFTYINRVESDEQAGSYNEK